MGPFFFIDICSGTTVGSSTAVCARRVNRRVVQVVSRLHFCVGRMLRKFGWCQAECAHQPIEKLAKMWLRQEVTHKRSPARLLESPEGSEIAPAECLADCNNGEDPPPDFSGHPEATPSGWSGYARSSSEFLLLITYYIKYDG